MSRPFPNGRHTHARVLAPTAPSGHDRERFAVVRAARAGDDRAWTALVRHFDAQLRRIARSYRLAPADIDDALQATWVRLYKSIARLDNPDAISAWLATTTRRECLRILQAPVREFPTDDPLLGDSPRDETPYATLVAGERRALLRSALDALPRRHRRLMVMLAAETTTDYAQISETLSIPVGSIGPMRQRCLARLASDPRLGVLRTRPD
jgi:RNA polymerase sigma factor (sigma-70 family)